MTRHDWTPGEQLAAAAALELARIHVAPRCFGPGDPVAIAELVDHVCPLPKTATCSACGRLQVRVGHSGALAAHAPVIPGPRWHYCPMSGMPHDSTPTQTPRPALRRRVRTVQPAGQHHPEET